MRLHLPLSQLILSVLEPWSKIIPLTSNMHSGLYNQQDPSLLSQNLSGNMSSWGWQSTLIIDAIFSGLFSTHTDDKTTASISNFDLSVGGCKPSKLSRPTETGPSHETLHLLQSSVPSLIVPSNCSSTLSTCFSFSEPFSTHTPKSLTLTKQPVITLRRSSTLNSPMLASSVTLKLSPSKMMVGEPIWD